MKRRRSKGRNRRVKHPCELGWRVRWTARFRRRGRELGIWGDVRRELKDIERRLRCMLEHTLGWLKSMPVIGYVIYKGKRYAVRRMYFGKRTARGFYVVREDICRVWFVVLTARTNSTYRRKRFYP